MRYFWNFLMLFLVNLIARGQIVSTIAGNGIWGYGGDGGQATSARLFNPYDVFTDTLGCIYIVDFDNSCIRKVDTNGVIITIAGTGVAGFSGDGGLAVNAKLNLPWNGGMDNKGNIYISDYGNKRIRKINAQGIIFTIAGRS